MQVDRPGRRRRRPASRARRRVARLGCGRRRHRRGRRARARRAARPAPVAGRRPRLARQPALADGARACRSSARRPTRTSPTPSWRCSRPSAGAPTRITVLGAFGGPRLDHALANLWLLATRLSPARRRPPRRGDARVLAGHRSRLRRVTGRRPLPGPRGRLSRCCRSAATSTGVTTDGLRYPLHDEPLLAGPARGLSNVRDRRAPRRPSGAAGSSSSRPLPGSRP